MGNLFKKYKSRLLNNGKKFLSVVDFFEMNLYKKELQNFNPLTNNHNGVTTGPTEQTIYTEPFGLNGINVGSGGFPYYNYPTGWTGTPDYVNWLVYGDSDVTPFCSLPGSSGTMYLAFANGNIGLEVVNTIAISTISKTNIKINFNEYRGYATGLTPPLDLYYSPDNGSNWFPITWTEPVTTLAWVNTGDISLPVGAENNAQLKIRFSTTGDASAESIAIDDFIVKATF